MWKIISTACASLALVACDMAQMEADKLDSMELDPVQRSVAEALIKGLKMETAAPMLRSRDFGRAVYYAKSVDMPSRFHNAHTLYLANYPRSRKTNITPGSGNRVLANRKPGKSGSASTPPMSPVPLAVLSSAYAGGNDRASLIRQARATPQGARSISEASAALVSGSPPNSFTRSYSDLLLTPIRLATDVTL